MKIVTLLLFFITIPLLGDFEKPKMVAYFNDPVSISINQGDDAVIAFPEAVKVKTATIEGLEINIVDNTRLIFKANIPLDSYRLIVRIPVLDKEFLILVTTKDKNKGNNYQIILGSPSKSESFSSVKSLTNPYVLLTRYAAMKLYYPERIKSILDSNIHRVVTSEGVLDYLFRLNVSAKNVGTWKGYGFYITAVHVANLSNEPITLNPVKHYRGSWDFSSQQHTRLSGISKYPLNETIVYFVSSKPFWVAVSQ